MIFFIKGERHMAATNGNDLLVATSPGQLLDGLAGNDTLLSAFWDTTLIGGSGTDRIETEVGLVGESEGQPSSSVQSGEGGNDSLVAKLQPRFYFVTSEQDGGDGDDSILGDFLASGVFAAQTGGAGNDILESRTSGADSLLDILSLNLDQTGGEGDDRLTSVLTAGDLRFGQVGGSGSDTLVGDLVAEFGSGFISGDSGADRIDLEVEATYFSSLLDGGSGHDRLSTRFFLAGIGEGKAELESRGGDGDDRIETRIASGPGEAEISSADLITRSDGGGGSDYIFAEVAPNVILFGGSLSANFAQGGAGDDEIVLFAATSFFSGSSTASNTADGGVGNDIIRAAARAPGNGEQIAENYLTGGSGADLIRASASTNSNFGTGIATNFVSAGEGNDDVAVAQATSGPEASFASRAELDGGDGNDRLSAWTSGSGELLTEIEHRISGGAGQDVVASRLELDMFSYQRFDVDLAGGAGNDRVINQIRSLGITLGEGLEGRSERLDGGTGNDVIASLGDYDVRRFDAGGAPLRATLLGGDGDDRLDASVTLRVLDFADSRENYVVATRTLEGGAGNDVISMTARLHRVF
jgi:serralysin